MVDKSIIKSVQRYLKELVEQGIPVHYGVLFGSQLNQSHTHIWSDIDLLVVSPRFDNLRKREDMNILWRVAARIDSRIEPIAVGVHQWETDDSSPIVEIARRKGEKILLSS